MSIGIIVTCRAEEKDGWYVMGGKMWEQYYLTSPNRKPILLCERRIQ
jgi:hypothetical protein